jgi:hypothetical protein
MVRKPNDRTKYERLHVAPNLEYTPREEGQSTFVGRGEPIYRESYRFECPLCHAPPGLDCMAVHPTTNPHHRSRFPVRAHRQRRALVRAGENKLKHERE